LSITTKHDIAIKLFGGQQNNQQNKPKPNDKPKPKSTKRGFKTYGTFERLETIVCSSAIILIVLYWFTQT
jgi:hypothetical protein